MKIKHKVPVSVLRPKQEPISDAYQAEIDASLRKAERAWLRAKKAAERAEEKAAAEPSPEAQATYRDVLAEAERLRLEFEAMRQLMQQPPVGSSNRGAGQVRHRTGRDDHLEQGLHKRKRAPRKPRRRRSL